MSQLFICRTCVMCGTAPAQEDNDLCTDCDQYPPRSRW